MSTIAHTAHATPATPSTRPTCPHCARPLRTCMCAAVRRVDTATQVLILLHPAEVGHAKGTGTLLHQCLPHSRLEVGEAFDPATLHDWLHGAWPGLPHSPQPGGTALLYPDAASPASGGSATNAASTGTTATTTRLVVLDATWRKSRKMLLANPLLQALPRRALVDVPASRYRIRTAEDSHQLSTLEATHLALRTLEPGNPAIDGLSTAMNALMALQRPFWPAAR